jgi:hypothetical protein
MHVNSRTSEHWSAEVISRWRQRDAASSSVSMLTVMMIVLMTDVDEEVDRGFYDDMMMLLAVDFSVTR